MIRIMMTKASSKSSSNTIPKHGTIIQTGVTCQKIPCYMRDSTCRWVIVKKVEIF